MNIKSITYKKLIVVAAILFLGGFGLWMYRQAMFRIINTTPNLSKTVATSTSSIRIEFNREIDDSKISSESFESDGLIKNYRVDKNVILLSINQLSEKSDYTIVLKNIYSKKGEVINQKQFDITAGYVSFGKLSQEDVDLQMQAVDPPSSLGAILPHEGTMYNIASTEIEGQISIEMRFSVTEDYYTNPKYLSNVRKYRKEAFEYLKSNGVDINAYTYIYTEPVLLDEFPKGKYYGQHDEEASIH